MKDCIQWKTLIYWMDICCRYTLELPLWGNSNVYLQHMLLKLMEPILKYTFIKNHVHYLCLFKHLNLPISIKIPVTIWQIVYIYMTAISPKFDFKIYAFAKLVVVWLKQCNLHLSSPWMESSSSSKDLGGAPACFFLCLIILCFNVNLFWQMSHSNGRSPVSHEYSLNNE